MADLNSSGDPDADAAFGGPATVAAPVSAESSGDPDADAAVFKDFAAAAQAKNPSMWDKYVGFQEAQLSGLTGGVGSLAGGMSYLGRRLEGGSEEEAQAERQRSQHALTYEPRTAEGKRQAAGISEAASYLGEKPGHLLGGGLSSAATALGAPPEVAGGAGAAGEVVGNIPEFIFGPKALDAAGRPRPGIQAATDRALHGDPAVNAQNAVDKAYQAQSMGAAGAAPDISKASPAEQKAIADYGARGVPINREVLERRLRAEKFGIRLSEGQATRDAGIYSNEVNSRAENAKLQNHFNSQPGQLADALDNLRAEASPSSVQNNAREHGQTALDEYKTYDQPIKAQVSANYKALADANGGDMPLDGGALVDSTDAALKKQNKARYLPAEVRGTLDDLRDGGNFTFDNFENLRTDLAAAARKADRAGDGNAKAAINIARNTVEQLPMPAASAPMRALADTARASAKARFDAIEADPAYEAAVNDDVPKGQPSALADNFMDKYVVGAPRANLARIQEKFSGNPNMQEAIAGHTLNTLKEKAGVKGDNTGFVQNGFNNHIAKLKDKLDLLVGPDMAQRVQELGETARDVQKYPEAHTVNTSNSAIVHAARQAAELGLQAKTGGFGMPILRSIFPDKVAERALAPGAGLDYRKP